MRWYSLILVLFAAAFLFACGGDEYGDTGDNTADGGGGDTAKKDDQAPPKKEQTLSPLARQLDQQRRMCLAVKDEAAQAKKALEQAEQAATQSVSGDALFYHGELWRLANQYGKATESYIKFMQQCPTDKNYWTALYYTGVNLCKDGRPNEALPHVNNFATKFPDQEKYLKSMASTVGYALLGEGDFTGAIKMLGMAADLGDKYAGEEMVRCMWAMGDYDQALTKANDLKARFKGDPEQERYDTLADLASRMGKPILALDLEGWSRQFNPESLKGKLFLVYFWSVRNRGTAEGTEKRLLKLYDRYNGEGLEIVGISKPTKFDLVAGATNNEMGTEEELHQLKVWSENIRTPWILGLAGDDTFHDYFGFRGKVPAIALVGKDGKLRYFRDSKDEEGYVILAKEIEKLLEE